MMCCEKKPPDQMKIAFVMVISRTLLQLQIKHSSELRKKKKNLNLEEKLTVWQSTGLLLQSVAELGLRVPV